MHVKDQVEACFPAPVHNAVYAGETVLVGGQSHIILVGEQFIMEGETDGVGSRPGDELYIFTGDIVVFECFPEFGGEVGAYHFTE